MMCRQGSYVIDMEKIMKHVERLTWGRIIKIEQVMLDWIDKLPYDKPVKDYYENDMEEIGELDEKLAILMCYDDILTNVIDDLTEWYFCWRDDRVIYKPVELILHDEGIEVSWPEPKELEYKEKTIQNGGNDRDGFDLCA